MPESNRGGTWEAFHRSRKCANKKFDGSVWEHVTRQAGNQKNRKDARGEQRGHMGSFSLFIEAESEPKIDRSA